MDNFTPGTLHDCIRYFSFCGAYLGDKSITGTKGIRADKGMKSRYRKYTK